MDRPGDTEFFAALDGLELPAVAPCTGLIEHLEPSPLPRSFALETLAPYMRGVQLAMTAMAERMRDPADRDAVLRTATMAEEFVKAQAATRRTLEAG